jgi:4'-phosphopantetheinyl transferase
MAVVHCEIGSPRARLGAGETHVYAVPVADPDAVARFLTDEERERASRFRLGRVRDQFVVARGFLRSLLGGYLALDPRAVPILYADGGKPHLPPEYSLHFNLSHTDGLAVFAFGHSRVGVDVERHRAIPDADGLVSRFFSRRECAEFETVAAEMRIEAFLRAWTRKEAVLKAIGRGVASLDCCEVNFIDDAEPRLLCLDGDENAGDDWELFTWQPAEGYLAAGAVER